MDEVETLLGLNLRRSGLSRPLVDADELRPAGEADGDARPNENFRRFGDASIFRFYFERSGRIFDEISIIMMRNIEVALRLDRVELSAGDELSGDMVVNIPDGIEGSVVGGFCVTGMLQVKLKAG